MARVADSTVSINNSPGCNIPRVIIGNRRDAYASSAALGVDHLPIADIDCDMAHAGNIPMDGRVACLWSRQKAGRIDRGNMPDFCIIAGKTQYGTGYISA